MFKYFLIIFIIVLWLYCLSVLKRAHLTGIYFWIGSFGLFILSTLVANIHLIWLMAHLITAILGWLSYVIPGYTVNLSNNLINVITHHEHVQLFINYECSGTIETLAYESLLIFYPIYTKSERFIIGISGAIWILVANLCRLLLIIVVVNQWGTSSLFWAHSLVGRLFFYSVVLVLYYNTFTRAQIRRGWRQRKGEQS